MSIKDTTTFLPIRVISSSETLTVNPTYFSDINSVNKEYFQTTNKLVGKSTMNIRPYYNRLFFHSLFGSETSEAGYYNYSALVTPYPMNIMVGETTSSTSFLTMLYENCYVTGITLSAETKEFIKMNVDWTAYSYTDSSTYTIPTEDQYKTEEPIPFYKFKIETSTGVASLAETYLKRLNISFKRNTEDGYYINSVMPQNILNSGSFDITGEMTFDADEYDDFSTQLINELFNDVELKISIYTIDEVKTMEIYLPKINYTSSIKNVSKGKRTKSVSFITDGIDSYVKIYKTES